jgi:hypothetical protein
MREVLAFIAAADASQAQGGIPVDLPRFMATGDL